MAALPLVMMAVGTATSAVGQIKQGAAAQKAAEYNAAVQNNNAILAERQGEYEAKLHRADAAKHIGAMRAQFAASGLDINSSSAFDVLEESLMNAERDNLMIKHNAKVRATGLRSDAGLTLYEGQQRKAAAGWAAAGTSLQGLGEMSGTGAGKKMLGIG